MSQKRRWCARCKVEISAERIEALPDTRLCIECSKQVGGEFDVSFSTESLGKAGSMKKNYGGIEKLVKKRKRIEPID